MSQIRWRQDTAANFTTGNPTLAQGEPAKETDTGKWKLGDGVTAWTSLGYQGGGAPSGAAGGSLAGTYPNPTLAAGAVGTAELAATAVTTAKIAPNAVTNTQLGAGAVQDTNVAAANKDGAAATPSMRTLGTGAAQAVAGNDSRLSNTRTPTAHASTHASGGSDPVTPAAIGADVSGAATAAQTAAIAASAQRASNLSDLASPSTALANIGAVGTGDTRLFDARIPTAHSVSHLPGSGDALTTAAPGSSAVGDSPAAGSAASFARSDHVHGREGFGAVTAATAFGVAAADGTASTDARSDHVHGTPALGITAATAAAGNDPRLSDARSALAPNWAAATAYKANQLVLSSGVLYRRTADGTSGATFDSSTWTQVAPWLPAFARRTTDLVRNNTAVQAADTQLTVAVAANGVYQVTAMLITTATTTADVAFGWTGPAGATLDWTPNFAAVSATAAIVSVNRAGKSITDVQAHGGVGIAATNKITALPSGLLVVGSSTGSLTLTWAQNVAEASDATLYTGSYLRLTRLA